MVKFITEGLNRGGWSSFPLYFESEYEENDLGTLIVIDGSIVIEENPIDSGERWIRRVQSHLWMNRGRGPEFWVKVTGEEYRCLLVWHLVSYTYGQGKKIEYTVSNEREAYSGRHNGRGMWERWFKEDEIYKNETMSLRFVRESNRGEPAEFELQEILKEKQRRYNEYYERWSRGEAARRVEWNRREREEYSNNREDYKEREFNLKEYVPVISRGVDLRSIRPITREKIRGMRDEEIFYYEGNTKTVERVVLGIMSRIMKPRERENFGITK
jgi:hypothetical protein